MASAPKLVPVTDPEAVQALRDGGNIVTAEEGPGDGSAEGVADEAAVHSMRRLMQDAAADTAAIAAAAPPAVPASSPSPPSIYVINRHGEKEAMELSRIEDRLTKLAVGLKVDIEELTRHTMQHMQTLRGIKTTELDNLSVRAAQTRTLEHPDYGLMAGRLICSNLQKNAPATFSEAMERLAAWRDELVSVKKQQPILSSEFMGMVRAHADTWNTTIVPDRDLLFDAFGACTLKKSYLLRAGRGSDDSTILETPQYMYMRVAVALFGNTPDKAVQLYHLLSRHYATVATPTMFNAGRPKQQLSSCILMTMQEDSLSGIYSTLDSAAQFSKFAAGLGLSVSRIRGKGAYISGTGGISNGIPRMLQVFNASAKYVDQGGGKRPGSMAIYIEPWHIDTMAITEMRLPTGAAEDRARDLFYAWWIPDEFMRRVEQDLPWTLMCPSEFPEGGEALDEVWGEVFDVFYQRYEALLAPKIDADERDAEEAKAAGRKAPPRRTLARRVRARDMWAKMLEINCETGMPYILFKDAANRTSNQQHLGTIRSSNLCAEIVEFTAPGEVAVCNLASLGLPKFVTRPYTPHADVDYTALEAAAYDMTRVLDRVIDVNFYPHEDAERGNKQHRPVGLGVQGLADVLAMLGEPYDSPRAQTVNNEIFAAMYHGAIRASATMAQERAAQRRADPDIYAAAIETVRQRYEEDGMDIPTDQDRMDELVNAELGAFPSYHGCPLSAGILQFDMWKPDMEGKWMPSTRWNWEALRNFVFRAGVRNSLCIALMPTASTSQIMGNAESFAPYMCNVFARQTQAGEFTVWNKHLVRDLEEAGTWTPAVRAGIIANQGSVVGVQGIPPELVRRYRTAWEIRNKPIIRMAADRGHYVCQSQSMNLYVAQGMDGSEVIQKLHAALMYAWRLGLPTGKYYARSRSEGRAQTIVYSKGLTPPATKEEGSATGAGGAAAACPMRRPGVGDDEVCIACSA